MYAHKDNQTLDCYSMLHLFQSWLRPWTICQPSLRFERIEGERASPENSNKEFGFWSLNCYTFALKLTIPPLLYLVWMSYASLKWMIDKIGSLFASID